MTWDELGNLFHEDATFVNVIGSYLRGRDEIRQHHAAAHAGPFRESVLRAEVMDVRELAPGVIVAQVRTELAGDARAPGQTRRTVATFVIDRRAGLWRIAAAQDTNVVPPVG